MQYIYEHDMPKSQDDSIRLSIPNNTNRFVAYGDHVAPPKSWFAYKRWKPNGITDNRRIYEYKKSIREYWEKTAKLREMIEIIK